MHILIGHHHLDNQSVTVGVVDKVCITFFENDVVILPLELLCRPLVHAVGIGDQPLLCLLDISFLRPTRFFEEVRSIEDCPNFM